MAVILSSIKAIFVLCIIVSQNKYVQGCSEDCKGVLLQGFQSLRTDFDVRMTQMDSKLEKMKEELIKVEQESNEHRKWSSLIIPSATTPQMRWVDSWSRCAAMGASPFVPNKQEDFEIIKTVQIALGVNLWIPASDILHEGVLKWWDGQDVSDTQILLWQDSTELPFNSESENCLLYGTVDLKQRPGSQSDPRDSPHPGVNPYAHITDNYDGLVVYPCRATAAPMICYKMD